MKKLAIILFAIISGAYEVNAQAKLYLNFRSHNETTDSLKYEERYSAFDSIRTELNKIRSAIVLNNAAWNMQVESNFINAVIKWEKPTKPTTLLKQYDSYPQIEIDLHNHFNKLTNPYNYADLNYLITKELGMSKRDNIGGIWWQDTSTWNMLKNGQACNYFSAAKGRPQGFTYRPTTLTGGGSDGDRHNLYVYGSWLPSNASSSSFLTNDPTSNLFFIGDGCHLMLTDTTDPEEIGNEIINFITGYLATKTDSGYVDYTGSIMFNFRDIPGNNFDIKIRKIITMLQPYVDSHQLVWSTYSDKLIHTRIYADSTNYFQVDCTTTATSSSGSRKLNAAVNDIATILVYPNPASYFVNINSGGRSVVCKLFNNMGQLVKLTKAAGNAQINVSGVAKGIYILQCCSNNGQILKTEKLLIQ